jgi:ATP-dependent Clp protease ATP-binding subunit ClpA
VLHREIKTKLMREILFGKLKRGGTAHISLTDGKITLK